MTFNPQIEAVGQERRPRVLLVEPNRRYLAVLARRLHEQGYRIVTAENAEAALTELHRLPAELILCEARLPGNSGVELIRMIREDAVHCDLPFLLIVGRSDAAAAVKGFEAGADGIVHKPFHFEVIAACLAREIERARSRRLLLDTNAALDARAVSRAIEAREIHARYEALEAQLARLTTLAEIPA
jgi:DNA-binding response OmpR family regulator